MEELVRFVRRDGGTPNRSGVRVWLGDAAAAASWDAFAGLQSNGAPSDFSVTDDAGTRSASVTLAGPPEVVPIHTGLASYVLQLVARDPVKYGPMTRTGSAACPDLAISVRHFQNARL